MLHTKKLIKKIQTYDSKLTKKVRDEGYGNRLGTMCADGWF